VTLEKLRLFAERAAVLIALIIPLLLALLSQIRGLARFLPDLTFWMALPSALVFLGFLVLQSMAAQRSPARELSAAILAVACAAAVRLFLITLLSSTIESDFWDIHRFAADLAAGRGLANAADYTFIPRVTYLNTTAGFLSIFYRLFGPSVRVGKLVMVACAALGAAAIYAAAKQALRSHAAALVAVLIFAFWPALAAYTGMTSMDHPAIFLIALVFFIAARLETAADTPRRALGFIFLLGPAIGLVDWFRPVGIVLCLALILSELLYTNWRAPRALGLLLVRAAGLLLVFSLVSGLSSTLFSAIFRQPLQANNQRMGESLFIGMNVDSSGMYSGADAAVIAAQIEQSNGDGGRFNRAMLSLAWERFNANRAALPALLARKFNTAWSGNQQLFEFSLHGSNDQELAGYLEMFDAVLTPAVFLGALIAAGAALFRRPGRTVLAMLLYILGFALMLLATEVQNRYRLVLTPVLVILAASGFAWLARLAEIISTRLRPRQSSN
jgi:hypothetical protein